MALSAISTCAAAPHDALKYVTTKRLRFATYDQGDGPAIVLLHGFPELAYSWRFQIPALKQAGWRVIAPDLRGYGQTGVSGDVGAYSMRNLALDVTSLLDALGIDQAVAIGHDFGGALAWTLARDHADRIRGIISLNTPYTHRASRDLAQTMLRFRGAKNYMVQFQSTGIGESLLERDVDATFRGLMRRPRLPLHAFRELPHQVQALPMTLFVGGEAEVAGDPLLSEDELQVYVEAFQRTGFGGGLSWYRNLHQNWVDTENVVDRVVRPALMVCARDDYFLPPDTTLGMEKFVPDLESQTLICGHWTQQELPAETNSLIMGWLNRRMK